MTSYRVEFDRFCLSVLYLLYFFCVVTMDVTILSCGYSRGMFYHYRSLGSWWQTNCNCILFLVHRCYIIKVRFRFFLYCVSINKSLLPCPGSGVLSFPAQRVIGADIPASLRSVLCHQHLQWWDACFLTLLSLSYLSVLTWKAPFTLLWGHGRS